MIKVKTLSKVIRVAVFCGFYSSQALNHLVVQFSEQSLSDNFYYSSYGTTSSVGCKMSLFR